MVDHRHKLGTVVAKGDMQDSLQALANKLATRFDAAPIEQVAGIAGKLTDLLKTIDEITPDVEGSVTDDLAKQRQARREKAAAPAPTAKGKQRSRRGGGAG